MLDEIKASGLHAEKDSNINIAHGNITQSFNYNVTQASENVYFDLPAYTIPLGRDEELKDFYNRWLQGTRHLLLYGARGMGKACLARALAQKIWQSDEKYPFRAGLWWSAGYKRPFEEFFDYIKSALSFLPNINPKLLNSIEGVYLILRQNPVLLVVTKVRRKRHQKLLDFLQGIPGNSTVILTATTAVAGWNSRRLQKLELDAAINMLKEKARTEGCENIFQAPEDKLRQLCELCDGSPVALSMVVKVFLGENPDIDLVLENISTGKDTFRSLCAIAYDELSELAKKVFRLLCLSQTSYAVLDVQFILDLAIDELKEALSELVDSGLVFFSSETDLEQRRFYPAYRLIREYYQHTVSLANKKADQELKEQIATYYLDKCQENGGENWAGYDWLEREIPEIFTVVESLYQQKDWTGYFAMLDAIYYFLGIRGYWRQKRDLGLQAALAARATGDQKHEALALVRVAGWTEIQLKMFAQAEEHVGQGLQLYEKLQDAGGKASALRYLGSIRRRGKDFTGALELYRAALQACEAAPSPSRERVRAGIQVSLSMLHCKEGRLAESRKQLEEALEVFQSIGHLSKIAEVLSRLGDLDLIEGKTADAEQHFTQSESLVQKTGRSKTRAYNFLGLARLKALGGDEAAASQLAEQARQLFRKLEIADESGEINDLLKLIKASPDRSVEPDKAI